MSELNEESGTTEDQSELDWDSALSEQLQNLSNEPEISEESIQAEGTESEETDSKTDQDSQPSGPEPLEPLEHWSNDYKEFFGSLDPDTQVKVLGREKELERGLTEKGQELSELRKGYEALDEVLKPYQEVFVRQGLQTPQVVAQALNLMATVNSDPAGAVKQAIQAYGLTPEQLGLAPEDDFTDPTIKALKQQISGLEQRLSQTTQSIDSNRYQEGQSQIDAFKSATDDEGNPKYPLFDKVRSRMAPIVEEGKTLEEAYNDVIYSLPEYREELSKAERDRIKKELQEASEADREKKARQAKKSRTLPVSDVDSSDSGPNEHVDWGSSLQETLNQLQSQ